VLGTLVVERADGLPPDRAEFNDLILFGRKLAGIIEQSERIQLLQQTLDQQREPLAIFDARRGLRYLNGRCAAYLNHRTPAGWQHPEDAYHIDVDIPGHRPTVMAQARETVRDAFRSRNRRLVTAREPQDDSGPIQHAWAVHADIIKDQGNDQTLGLFVEGENLSSLYRIISALERLLRPETLYPEPSPGSEPSDLNPTQRLLAEIGRVFTEIFGQEAVYFDKFDAARKVFVRRRRYSPGAWEDDDPSHYSYPAQDLAVRCLETVAPLAFYYDRAGDFPNGGLSYTDQGLGVIAVRSLVGAPEDLGPSSLWVDFPLLAGNRPLGKIVFACKQDLLPEDFELLKAYLILLCRVVGALFELAGRYEQDAAEKIQAREQSARDAVDNFIHHIRRPIKSLPITLGNISRYAPDDPRLPGELERLKDMIRRFDHYSRIVEAIDSFQLSFSPVDLAELIRSTLEQFAPPGHYESPSDPTFCEVDPAHFKLLLSELVENSRKYCDEKGLQITVLIETEVGAGGEWVRLIYQDNGPGIPAASKSAIFERGRVIERPGVRRSTGLGLYYVDQIVRGHGGTVRENGEEGLGVRIVIELPRSREVASCL
jgi:signal transduction histidine kinase